VICVEIKNNVIFTMLLIKVLEKTKEKHDISNIYEMQRC
jgi:hypothetical protein